jgi:sugar O-acyltransferase (sialic acid O-acetyltransferase NeuD family)
MDTRLPLVVLGAGGLGREIADIAGAMNRDHPQWDIRGFLDDDRQLSGSSINDIPVLGGLDDLHRFDDARFVVALATPRDVTLRARVTEKLEIRPDRLATIIHPTASVGESCAVGPGSVLFAGVVATANVHIGMSVVAMPHVVFTHDDVIDDYATFGAGVRVAGRVSIGRSAYVGSGSLIRENVRVGAEALVGMGAVVTKDIPSAETWIGVPARPYAGDDSRHADG